MATRKLQSEIERTLKKVTEGLEIFHDTLEKLESATSPAQKEKIEGELKKEIKKLQRLRDLIKGWQVMSELKDKTAINDARKSIEHEMERFKTLEKEMKIKAYSKEGLSQAAKLDPLQQEKISTFNWVNSAVDKLNTQRDALEAELESLQILARKSKRLDSSEKQKRLENLPQIIERHKQHTRKLEQLLRFMGNDRVSPEEINGVKDDVEYYIEAFDEQDYMPDDQLYDQFDLPEEESDEEDDSGSDSDAAEPASKAVAAKIAPEPKKAPEVKKLAAAPAPVVVPVAAKTAPQAVDKKKGGEPAAKATPSAPAASPAISKAGGPSFASAIAATVSNSQVPSAMASSSASPLLKAGPVSMLVAPRQSAPVVRKPHPYEELYAIVQRKQNSIEACRSPADTLAAIESSFAHCPDGAELERSRAFTPQQPYAVPSYYPTHPAPILENPSVFERFELDMLFFIFYYQQHTYAQYLSARELKRQSWRFHKKYLTWFQRHEEPKTITDEFEQGTYIYFDYEGSWCQRKKSEFTFEYRFLEDEDGV